MEKNTNTIVVKRRTFGRQPILTPEVAITRDNIIDVLRKAIPIFERNAADCIYLYNYYKGKQPILDRQKIIRPEICNTIVVNRAYEIVTFKTGRFLYKPILYVNRNEKTTAEVNALNSFMYSDNKNGKDRQLVDWMHICGHGYRMTIDAPEKDGTPFHTYTVEPMRAFVVRRDTYDQKTILGVYVSVYLDEKKNKHKIYTCYSDSEVFTVENYEIKSIEPHILGDVPIVEYPANYARLGCFEMVIELLDAINLATSNRQDGLEQFIQALLVFKNIDLEEGDVTKLKSEGAICIPEGSDVDYLVHELNQTQTQTLVDDLYQAVLTICGMPNRQSSSKSTSDNKGAVVLRDGWSAAATAVKETRQYFEASERETLSMILPLYNLYMDAKSGKNTKLTMSDLEVHFDEGEYENMLEKAQVLTMLLSNDRVHPKDAFAFSNITADPEAAYLAGEEFHEQMIQEQMEQLDAPAAVGHQGETFVQGHWRNDNG